MSSAFRTSASNSSSLADRPLSGIGQLRKPPFRILHGSSSQAYLRHSYEPAVVGPAQLLAGKTLVALPQGLLYRVQRTLI
jgi:hypothetical protein